MKTWNKYYCPLAAFLFFIYESSTRQVYGVSVKRLEEGDEFDNPICVKGCRTNVCDNPSQNCRDAGGKMFCNGDCCHCDCKYKSTASTFVGFQVKCVKNRELPQVFGYNMTDYDFRLVAAESDGKSCEKQRAPLLNVNKPGSKVIAMCALGGTTSRFQITDIKSCDAVLEAYRYYSGGYWKEVQHNGQSSNAFTFTLKHNIPEVNIQWSKVADGSPHEGHIFSLVVRCFLNNRTTGQLRGLLIFKNNGSSPANTIAPIQLPTTTPSKPSTMSTRISSSVPSTLPQTTTIATTTMDTTTTTETTTNTSGYINNSEGFHFNTVLIAVIGGSAFTFVFMVVACVILMCVKKQRRELEMERSMTMSDKDNPVYGKGVSSTLQLQERESTSVTGSLPRDEPLVYQPLVENTRPRGATWGQQVYQPLATQRYSDIAVGNRKISAPRDIQRCSTLGRYECNSKDTNGFYQPLIVHKPGLPCKKPHVDHDYQECDDGYEEPPIEILPKNADKSDTLPTRNKGVENNHVPPYFEAGCVINTHNTNRGMDKKSQNFANNENNSGLDEEDNDYDSGKTMLDRQGRPFEPMYHVLEEPEIAVSETL